MSLNPNFSDFGASASAPSAKFTININAFNGNTTVFNRNPPDLARKHFHPQFSRLICQCIGICPLPRRHFARVCLRQCKCILQHIIRIL